MFLYEHRRERMKMILIKTASISKYVWYNKENYCKYVILTIFLFLTFNSVSNATTLKSELQEDFYGETNIHKSDIIDISFKPHDLALSVDEEKNLTCIIDGSLIFQEVTLKFNDTNNKLIDTIPDIVVQLNYTNKSLNIPIDAKFAGHAILFANALPLNMTDTSKAFIRIGVYHSLSLNYICDIVGWIYFLTWSISFYPQIILNWKRKSVIGLHFDFLALNTIGFLVYSIFNIGLYWIPSMETEYLNRHPFGINPVQLNDVIFSIHALIACLIQVLQVFIYERGDQKVSKTGRSILGGLSIFSIIVLILGGTTVITWLDFLYIMSYIKLFITLIKYIPQAYFNYVRKSTSGWSIGNIILDFTGGTFSIFQMFILAYNYNDWSSIFGDPTKFGLGLFSILFDILFIIQHYVLYTGYETYQTLPESSFSISNSLQESVGSNYGPNYGSIVVSVHS